MRTHSYVFLFAFSFLTLGLVVSGCDITGTDKEQDQNLEANVDQLNGNWQHASENAVDYVYIELPDVASYLQQEGCYTLATGRLERVSGDTFEIVEGDARTPSTLTIQGDTLTVVIEGNAILFERSTVDVEELPLCA